MQKTPQTRFKKSPRRRRHAGARGKPSKGPRGRSESWLPTLAIAIIVAAALTFFAALQQPSVDGSLSGLTGAQTSLEFLVRNATPLPIVGLRHACVLPETPATNPGAVRNPPVARPQDTTLWPNQSTTARCDKVGNIRTSPSQAQYGLTLSYYVFPVPYRWTVTRTLVALTEGGRIVRWMPH